MELEVNMCRCCLAQGLHKNLNATYTWCNKKEVYGNMLEECFNIVLIKYPDSSTGICDNCVTALRAAMEFRQGVLDAEQHLIKALCEKSEEKPEVKQEVKYESDDSDDYYLAEIRDNVPDNTETEEKVKVEQGVLPEKRKAPKRRKKPPVWDVDSLVATLTKGGDTKISKPVGVSQKKSRFITGTFVTNTHGETAKYKENLITILTHSNVLPFKTKNLLGYVCAYCESTFPDPKDLRTHTTDKHQNKRLNFKTKKSTADTAIKVDISNLICTICEEKMTNLTLLKEHLVKKHNKIIHNDIKDLIMQFKLKKGEEYECAMCPAVYETFKMLNQHMNKHYKNYICMKCSYTFSTKRSLLAHNRTHEEGSFKCEECNKVFSSKYKLQYHERMKHLGTRNIKNCPYCQESFRSYYQRNQHMIKVHNLEAQYKCNICDKSFILKSLLTCHVKKSHLMEQNCQCSECGYRFFSKKGLKAHMVKHSNEKNFPCTVCKKAFARKYTLIQHMRIHSNDRRFKCEICAMTFVQKCSLKSHLLSNHGISMAASEIFSTDSAYQEEFRIALSKIHKAQN